MELICNGKGGSDPFNVQVHKIVENPDGTFLHVSVSPTPTLHLDLAPMALQVANFSAPGPPPLEVTWNADMVCPSLPCLWKPASRLTLFLSARRHFDACSCSPLTEHHRRRLTQRAFAQIHFDVGGQPRVTSQTRLVLDANGSAGSAISLTPSECAWPSSPDHPH